MMQPPRPGSHVQFNPADSGWVDEVVRWTGGKQRVSICSVTSMRPPFSGADGSDRHAVQSAGARLSL